jgi:hypothetical protein
MSAVQFENFDTEVGVAYDEKASVYCDHDYWRTLAAFRYYFDEAKTTYVEIPANYLTDGASVPRPFWSLIPPMGAYGQAAILHDYLCEHLTVIKNGQVSPITRIEADDTFKDAMKVLQVPRWKRNVMFIVVAVYVKIKGIKGVDIDSKKAAYLAAFPNGDATLPAG